MNFLKVKTLGCLIDESSWHNVNRKAIVCIVSFLDLISLCSSEDNVLSI